MEAAAAAWVIAAGLVVVSLAGSGGSAQEASRGSWDVVGNMDMPREGHVAVLLTDGRVLVAGGRTDFDIETAAASLYDPTKPLGERWRPAGSMTLARRNAAAVLLPNGEVLVVGGEGPGAPEKTAEIYTPPAGDEGQGSWRLTQIPPNGARKSGHTATRLDNGDVLVVGSGAIADQDQEPFQTPVAEIYDHDSGTWSVPDQPAVRFSNHTATLLQNGKVLVAGGTLAVTTDPGSMGIAELYDPSERTWASTGSLTVPRHFHSATLLESGEVLVAGGFNPTDDSFLNTAEVYVREGKWGSFGSMDPDPADPGRADHAATLLTGGKVLVTGGQTLDEHGSEKTLADALLYDPGTNIWSNAPPMASARQFHTATRLGDGTVLVAGGRQRVDPCLSPECKPACLNVQCFRTIHRTYEVYQPSSDDTGKPKVTGVSPSSLSRTASRTVVIRGEDLLGVTMVLFGDVPVPPMSTNGIGTELRVRAPNAHDQPPAPSGAVQVKVTRSESVSDAGPGCGCTVRFVDSDQGTWSDAGEFPLRHHPEFDEEVDVPRSGHSATLLKDGRILVTGSFSGGPPRNNAAELYDPRTGVFHKTGSMNEGRTNHTASLLEDGRVLVAGGRIDAPLQPRLAEIYDPASEQWRQLPSMIVTRTGHTATVLKDGRVLVAGGEPPDGANSDSSTVGLSLLFDPRGDRWETAGRLNTSRSWHTATLLPSGKVLVTGGTRVLERSVVATAELFDPVTRSWTSCTEDAAHAGCPAPMRTARSLHTASTLPDKRVLVAGGANIGGIQVTEDEINAYDSAEIYDPATGKWASSKPMLHPRSGHSATGLPNGRILITGGRGSVDPEKIHTASEIFDPATESWFATGSMAKRRHSHSATLIEGSFAQCARRCGRVLVTAGCCFIDQDRSHDRTDAEIYTFDGYRALEPGPPAGRKINTGIPDIDDLGGGEVLEDCIPESFDPLRGCDSSPTERSIGARSTLRRPAIRRTGARAGTPSAPANAADAPASPSVQAAAKAEDPPAKVREVSEPQRSPGRREAPSPWRYKLLTALGAGGVAGAIALLAAKRLAGRKAAGRWELLLEKSSK